MHPLLLRLTLRSLSYSSQARLPKKIALSIDRPAGQSDGGNSLIELLASQECQVGKQRPYKTVDT